MIGIYLIRNKINGKVYVGQSTNIHRRWMEHLRSGQPELYSKKNERDSTTPIHLAMQKYGIENFVLITLEECPREELNDREKFWIKQFDSTNKKNGYNIGQGGQNSFALKGENHSQAKLTQAQVNEIKELLKYSNLTLEEISQRYSFVAKSTLSLINQGKTWHDENETYPLRVLSVGSKGSKNPKAKFTEEQVMEMRKLYSEGIAPKDIYPKYEHIASQSAINAILYNKTYTHLPKWNKKEQKWF